MSLSLKQRSRILKTWDALSLNQEVWVVWRKTKNDGRAIFTEAEDFAVNMKDAEGLVAVAFEELRDERAGLHVAREVVVRLFTSEEEAQFYMETVGAFYGMKPEEVEVAKVRLAELYDCREVIKAHARKQARAGVRFVLSRAQVEQQVPDTIDVLWSSAREAH